MNFGIDISEWQKNINLEKAKNEGVTFAILRGGLTGYGTGRTYKKDKCFEEFYTKCKELSIPIGVYWYSCAITYNLGRAEASFLYENCLKGKTFEYPIYIDVEDTHWQAKASNEAVTEAIKGFCEFLEDKGYYVGIYASLYWFRKYINTDDLKRYDKWVASWGNKRPKEPIGGLWQFGGSTNVIRTNKVAGLICDQDYSYKDYPKIIKSNGLNGFGKDSETRKEMKYIVKRGDNLSRIAQIYNTTWQKIAEDNKIANPNLILPGQELIIK